MKLYSTFDSNQDEGGKPKNDYPAPKIGKRLKDCGIASVLLFFGGASLYGFKSNNQSDPVTLLVRSKSVIGNSADGNENHDAAMIVTEKTNMFGESSIQSSTATEETKKNESEKNHPNVDLASLRKVAKQKAPLDSINDVVSGRSAGNLRQFDLKFPQGVFDQSMMNDPEYIRRIGTRCTDAIAKDSSNPREVLACNLVIGEGGVTTPIAMGPLELGVDYLNVLTRVGYRREFITRIFKNEALAVMIDEGCFFFRQLNSDVDGLTTLYSSSASYTESMQQSNFRSVMGEGTYGPVSVNAGYEQSTSSSSTSSSTKSYVYGERRLLANVGFLENRCLSIREQLRVIADKNLVKDEWLNHWRNLRDNDMRWNPSTIPYINSFRKVVKGGLMLPISYQYSVALDRFVDSRFESTRSETSSSVEKAVTAGISFEFVSGGGSFQAEAQSRIDKVRFEEKITSSLRIQTRAYGPEGFSASCFNEEAGTCDSRITEAVKEFRDDVNQITTPMNHYNFINIDKFAQMYLEALGEGPRGFDDGFSDSVNEYLSHQTCVRSKPDSDGRYSGASYIGIWNGDGTCQGNCVEGSKGSNCKIIFGTNTCNIPIMCPTFDGGIINTTPKIYCNYATKYKYYKEKQNKPEPICPCPMKLNINEFCPRTKTCLRGYGPLNQCYGLI